MKNKEKIKKRSKRNTFRLIWFSLVIIFTIWNWTTFQAHDLSPETLVSSSEVQVNETNDKITFIPVNNKHYAEVIFFQGGLTDPKAYAPLCRSLAEAGFTTHLIKMDWRLPQFDYQKTLDMFNFDERKFVIGGHSQGAKMAAQMVFENSNTFKGLFLLGTSHPRDIDLSRRKIPCLKLYAEHDGLASVQEVIGNENKLPINKELILIEGGNHSQFGYLGQLLMDNHATISLAQQQLITTQNLIKFFNHLN